MRVSRWDDAPSYASVVAFTTSHQLWNKLSYGTSSIRLNDRRYSTVCRATAYYSVQLYRNSPIVPYSLIAIYGTELIWNTEHRVWILALFTSTTALNSLNFLSTKFDAGAPPTPYAFFSPTTERSRSKRCIGPVEMLAKNNAAVCVRMVCFAICAGSTLRLST